MYEVDLSPVEIPWYRKVACWVRRLLARVRYGLRHPPVELALWQVADGFALPPSWEGAWESFAGWFRTAGGSHDDVRAVTGPHQLPDPGDVREPEPNRLGPAVIEG